MSGYIKEDASYFDGFDFENAKPIKHPLIAKAQANAKEQQLQKDNINSLLDDDVSNWLINQDIATKRHINEIIRQAMQLKMATTTI